MIVPSRMSVIPLGELAARNVDMTGDSGRLAVLWDKSMGSVPLSSPGVGTSFVVLLPAEGSG